MDIILRYMVFSMGGEYGDTSTLQVRINDSGDLDPTGKSTFLISWSCVLLFAVFCLVYLVTGFLFNFPSFLSSLIFCLIFFVEFLFLCLI